MLIGYALNSPGLCLSDLRDALQHAGCEKVFLEEGPNKAGTRRPELEAALAALQPDDTLVVWKLDQFGRSLVEAIRTVDDLSRRKIHFRSLVEAFDSQTPHGQFALQIQASVTGHFLDPNRRRTRESVEATLAKGRRGGRPRKLSDADLEAGRAMLATSAISITEIARRLGISRDTFYTYFPRRRTGNRQPPQ